MKKPPTKAEREMIQRTVDLGCIICGDQAEYHHCRSGAGMGQRNHGQGLPLCPSHHRHGPFGEAIHNGAKTFAARYGTESELVEYVEKLLAMAE